MKTCGDTCLTGEFKDGSVSNSFKCIKCDITNCKTCANLGSSESKHCALCVPSKYLSTSKLTCTDSCGAGIVFLFFFIILIVKNN